MINRLKKISPQIIICGLFAIITFNGFAQRNYANNWYFGTAAISFNGPQTAITTSNMSAFEGCASISDKNTGQLLFYTNGEAVWDRNNDTMPNGRSLLGNWSSTQSSLIVPMPDSNNVYFLFTTDAYEDTLKYGLRYSLVDMNLNSGFGDIRQGYKNILLVAPTCEKLTGLRHSNGTDYWVVTHQYNSDAFYSYLISNTGVSNSPVISNSGTVTTGNSLKGVGYLKASPNNLKLVSLTTFGGSGFCEVFDIDNSSGNIANPISIIGLSQPYSASFSPNSKLLYVEQNNNKELYQFNLSAGSVSAINATKVLAGTNVKGIQLGNDKKIYTGGSYKDSLSVIKTPDSIGSNCDYISNSIYLNGKTTAFGLPNFLDCWMLDSATYSITTGVNNLSFKNEENLQVGLYPNPFSNQTTLSFNVPNDCRITIELYSINGELLQTIVNELVEKDKSYSIKHDVNELASGVYFYKLNIGTSTIYKKAIITK
jgi:hypothetical protein